MVRVVAIIQARVSSSRLPAKVMLDLAGKTVLERVVNRVKLSAAVDDIWIATSTNSEDDLIEDLAKHINVNCYRGDLGNVINRYYETAELTKADIIVRVTADNPLTEPSFIDEAVGEILSGRFDYVSFKEIPLGSGVEVFTFTSFVDILSKNNLSEHNIEHVTSYYYQNDHLFCIKLKNKLFNETRLTIDTLDDYVKVSKIYKDLIDRNVDEREYLKEVLHKKVGV